MAPDLRKPRRGAGLGACALLTLLVLGCSGGEETPAAGSEEGLGSVDFAPELGVDLEAMERRSPGLYVQDVAEGEGRVAVHRSPVFVHYTGWRPDGTEIASSRDRGPFTFMLGMGQVIPAWEEGLVGVEPGGIRRLVVSPELASGSGDEEPAVPPNTPVVFEIEVEEVLPPAPTGRPGVESVSVGDTVPGRTP